MGILTIEVFMYFQNMRLARYVPLAAASIVAVSGLFLTGMSSSNVAASADSPEVTPSRSMRISTALRIVGVEPSALAAAGLVPTDASALVERAKAFLDENAATAWTAAETEYSAALKDFASRAQRSPESMMTARTRLASAITARDGLRAAFLAATLDTLSQEVSASLSAILSNRDSGLPMQYRVVQYSASTAMQLRDALADARIASRTGTQPAESSLAVIQAANSSAAVSSSLQGLEQNSSAIQLAWTQALTSAE